MSKYQCQVCGHVYDPAIGEPTQEIPPDTRFESLPEEWKCPVCGSPRSMYAKV